MRRLGDTAVYISDLKDSGNKKLLKKNHIKVILNVCNDIDTPHNTEITLMKVGLDDPKEGLAPRNDVETAAQVLDFAKVLAVKRDGNVLIHCAAGNNRSALVAALWMSRTYGKKLSETVKLAQVKDQKPWMNDLGYRW